MTRKRGERVRRARGGQHPRQNDVRLEPIDTPDGEEPLPVTMVASIPHELATWWRMPGAVGTLSGDVCRISGVARRGGARRLGPRARGEAPSILGDAASGLGRAGSAGMG